MMLLVVAGGVDIDHPAPRYIPAQRGHNAERSVKVKGVAITLPCSFGGGLYTPRQAQINNVYFNVDACITRSAGSPRQQTQQKRTIETESQFGTTRVNANATGRVQEHSTGQNKTKQNLTTVHFPLVLYFPILQEYILLCPILRAEAAETTPLRF